MLGDSGLLGQALVQRFLSGTDEVLGISSGDFTGNPHRVWNEAGYRHQKIDILKQRKLFYNILGHFKPQLLVNCAALVDLGFCEKEPGLAEALNSCVPEDLAKFTKMEGIRFIHISTDQVFDGKKSSPYLETDTAKPLHVYGQTKYVGEQKTMERNPTALVIRTNIVGFRDRQDRPTFAEWLSETLRRREPILLADDFVTSSVHVDALSQWIVSAHQRRLEGLFHFATRDSASKYDFGRQFALNAGLDFGTVKKGKLSQLQLKPERAPYLALDVQRGEKMLEMSLETIADTTRRLARDFQSRQKKR